jgi:hypothetical protein
MMTCLAMAATIYPSTKEKIMVMVPDLACYGAKDNGFDLAGTSVSIYLQYCLLKDT